MKTHLLTILILFSYFNSFAGNSSVNAIIGDHSFIAKFGFEPNANTEENLRLQTHLEYVENYLRFNPSTELSAEQKSCRFGLLDELHHYWIAGIFPKQTNDLGERKPCFIDFEGNICAVGYLIEKSSGRDAAEDLNEQYQFDFLLDMNSPLINNWASQNGFSLIELAMIQPTYENWFDDADPEPVEPVDFVKTVVPAPIFFEDVTLAVYKGPSKKEIALKAQIDSLNLASDIIHYSYDSILQVSLLQEKEIDSLALLNQNTTENLDKFTTESQEKTAQLTWIIYILCGAILAFFVGKTVMRLRLKKVQSI